MKQKRLFNCLFIGIAGALAFTSCSEVTEDINIPSSVKQPMTFTASYDKNINSRTSLGSDLSVLWSTNDAISVFDTDNNAFTLHSGAGTSAAQFRGEAASVDTYYALYPYQSGARISDNVINNVVIPSIQIATAGTFDPNANIMTAVSTSANNLAFKNVCSYAKITTTFACKQIEITAGNSDKIAGTFDMTIGADGIASATATMGTKTVTLVPSSDDTFAAGTYYIAINAGTIASLTVVCRGTDVTLFNSITASIDIFTRSSIIDLGVASVDNGWTTHIPQHVYEYGKGKEAAVAV